MRAPPQQSYAARPHSPPAGGVNCSLAASDRELIDRDLRLVEAAQRLEGQPSAT